MVDADAVCRAAEDTTADAAGVDDGAGDTYGAAADDSVAVAADAVGLRAVVAPLVAITLRAGAVGAGDEGAAGAAADDNAVVGGVTGDATADECVDGVGAGDKSAAGASADAKSDGSIDTQVPEYAESMGAFAHEPDKEVSGSVAADLGSSSAGGAALTAVARAAAAAAASAAFRMPLDSVAAGAGDGDFCVPLESAIVEASARCLPLGESDAPTLGSGVAEARALCFPLGESVAATVVARFAGVDALGAVPTDARVGVFAAAGLPPWPAGAGSTGGIPKPAGEPDLEASADGVAFAGGAARTWAGGTAGLGGGAGVAAGCEAPWAGFTSLAAESALEVLPFAGSSVDSNWSNPSRSSDSDS